MKNNKLKDLIVAYRDNGLSYKEVAEKTDTTEQFCRTVCSRAHRKRNDNQYQDDGTCRYCGNPLSYTNGAKPKQFCDDKCRSDFYNRVKMQKTYILTCETCRQKFASHGNANKRFCSKECLRAARRKE